MIDRNLELGNCELEYHSQGGAIITEYGIIPISKKLAKEIYEMSKKAHKEDEE